MRFLCGLILFLQIGCSVFESKVKEKDDASPKRLDELRARYALDLEAAGAFKDGWPSATDCDGTLFAGLAAAGGLPTNLDLAEYSPGEIHRRPAPSCWNPKEGDVGSKSTVSNDMILGYLYGRWRAGNLGALERLYEYGKDHSWIMGLPKSEASRVVLKPNQQGLLARAIFALGGKSHAERFIPATYFNVEKDYEKHLQAISILLNGEIDSGDYELTAIASSSYDRLKDLASEHPKDYLFQTALAIYSGNYDIAVDLLLDDKTPVPSYVRGDDPKAFALAHRLFVERLIIRLFD